jgi:hypothetical protein
MRAARASITARPAGIGLRADDHRHAALDDPGLFAGNLGHRVAQILLMVEADPA